MCAKHQPQGTNTLNAWICADVPWLVETTQPRSRSRGQFLLLATPSDRLDDNKN